MFRAVCFYITQNWRVVEMDVYVGKLMNLDALCKLMCVGVVMCVCTRA